MNFLLVVLVEALSSVLRNGCNWLPNGPAFPFGEQAVILAGSFLICLLWAFFTKQTDEPKPLSLTAGFCGGFTTFFCISLKGLQLLQQTKFVVFFLYTFATISLGLAAIYVGFKFFMHENKNNTGIAPLARRLFWR